MSSAIVRSGCGSFMSAGALAVVLACGGAPAPPPSAPPAAAAPPAAHAVTAVVLVNGCAHFGVENARLAQTAINALVDGCSSFTGERVQFTATLLPGGAIQFEPGAHDSDLRPEPSAHASRAAPKSLFARRSPRTKLAGRAKVRRRRAMTSLSTF